MGRDPPRSHELLEIRLKIRHLQQWIRNRLKPEVRTMRRDFRSVARASMRYRNSAQGRGSSQQLIGADGVRSESNSESPSNIFGVKSESCEIERPDKTWRTYSEPF